MNTISSLPQSIFGILKISLIYYIEVLKKIWPLTLMFVLLKNGFTYLFLWITHMDLELFFGLIFLVVTLFIFSLLLYQANEVIDGQSTTWLEDVKVMWQRFPRILLAGLFILGLFFGTLFLARALILWTGGLKSDDLTVILFFLIGFVLLVEAIYCFFMVPLIAVKNETWSRALLHSTQFLREDLRLTMLSYFSLILLVILIAPGSFHYLWLRQHFLSIPFDLVVTIILLPLILNIIIFSMRSMQERVISDH